MTSFNVNEEDQKLLVKILNNIIDHPQHKRFQDIKATLSNRFNDRKSMDILLLAGFERSNVKKEQRLLFQNEKYSQLEEVFSQLIFNQMFNETIFIFNRKSLDFKSKYLLKPRRLHLGDINGCDLQTCTSLTAISDILFFYDSYLAGLAELTEQKHDVKYINLRNSVYNMVNQNENYNDIDLLNDYHHLTTVHRQQFENISVKLTQTAFVDKHCNMLTCLPFMRNQRNRFNTQNNIMTELYKFENDVTSQQLLDSIHCHFIHTFDIGYKLTQEERDMITQEENDEKYTQLTQDDFCDNTVMKAGCLIRSKRKQYQNMTNFTRLNSKHKNISQTQTCTQMDPFSFGYRFHYWKFYKNNHLSNDDGGEDARILWARLNPANKEFTLADFYIENIFSDLREEVLYNSKCSIQKSEWNQLVNKAKLHILTTIARNMYCRRNDYQAKRYEMRYKQEISENHLIALMLYTNFDILQYEFSATYRKLYKNESIESVKERHSMYYFLGKLLRECVECFGMNKPEVSDRFVTFHGTNKHFTFSSVNAHIKGPLSTTLDYAVAVNFCSTKGMILELEIENMKWTISDNRQRLMCCDMGWISDFSNEQEIFFIGGRSPFRFNNITEATGINHNFYVCGLRRLMSGMTTGEFKPSFKEWKFDTDPNCGFDRKMAFRLLAHEFWRYFPKNEKAIEFKNCPDYIKHILHINFRRVHSMVLFESETKLHDKYFKLKSGWIDLDVVTKLFPNVEAILYCGCNNDRQYWTELSMFESILKFIQQNNTHMQLKKIEIMINVNLRNDMYQYIQRYTKDFHSYGWQLFIPNTYDLSQEINRALSEMNPHNDEHISAVKEFNASIKKLCQVGFHLPKYGGITFQKYKL